jgi:hypothetical protein
MDVKTAEANIGKIIHVSDGTPRPPARFTRKVREWERNNFSGILTEVEPNKWGEGKCYINIEEKRITGNNGAILTAVFNRSGWLSENHHLGEHPEAPADASIKV